MSNWAWYFALFFALNVAFCVVDDGAMLAVNVFGAVSCAFGFIASLVDPR